MKLVRPQNIESREALADAIAYSYGCFRTERYCRSPYSVDLVCLLRAILSPFDEHVSSSSNKKGGQQYSNLLYRLNILLVPKFMRFDVEKQHILSIKSKTESDQSNVLSNNFESELSLSDSFESFNHLSSKKKMNGEVNGMNERGNDTINNKNHEGEGGGGGERMKSKENVSEKTDKVKSDTTKKTTSSSSSSAVSGMSFADRERKGVEFVIYAVSIRAALLCRRFLLDVRDTFKLCTSSTSNSASTTHKEGQAVIRDVADFFERLPHHPALTASGLPLHKKSLLDALCILTESKNNVTPKLDSWVRSKPPQQPASNQHNNENLNTNAKFVLATFDADNQTQLSNLNSKVIDIDMMELAVGSVCEKALRELSKKAFLENDP
mmetsp:Transcript_19716/g.25702  ORF Transcript_19716/g.25702 Transcript_19716/m.25702 type:complete len:381 (+) Transcript_19716:265-1407(+)